MYIWAKALCAEVGILVVRPNRPRCFATNVSSHDLFVDIDRHVAARSGHRRARASSGRQVAVDIGTSEREIMVWPLRDLVTIHV